MNAVIQPEKISVMIRQAAAALDRATTAAEILDAQSQAKLAYNQAKAFAEFAEAKKAHDTVKMACRKVMADAIEIDVKAQCRLADEYDAAQARGEVHRLGGQKKGKKKDIGSANIPLSQIDIGLYAAEIFIARQLRNAEKAHPGIVRRMLDKQLQEGRAPTLPQRAIRNICNPDRDIKKRAWAPRRPRATDGHEAKIHALRENGASHTDIAAETGIHKRVVGMFLEKEHYHDDVPPIDASTLSMTAQEKLEAAIRQHQRKLDMQFEQRVLSEIEKRVNEMVLPTYNKTYAEWQDVIERRGRGGVMDKATFNKIVSCLHADSRLSASEQKLNEAFHAFHKLEHLLVKDPEPAIIRPLPKTYEEMMALKKSVSEARKQNRQAMRAR